MQELLPREAPEPAEGQEADALSRLRVGRSGLAAGLAVATLSGLFASTAFPPLGLWPVAFVALVPFLWCARAVRPRRGFAFGLAFGVGFFGATLSWIALFGFLAWSVLVLGSALAIGAVGALAPALWRPEHPARSVAGIAALWVVLEAVRGAWPFGGFTWGELGVSQVADPAILPLARILGVWGVSFAVVAVDAALLVAIDAARERRPRRALGALLAIAALAFGPTLIPGPPASGRPLRVALLQVDVRPFRGLPPAEEDRAVTSAIASLHDTLGADPPDLAVWGESAIDPGSTGPAFWDRVVGAAVRRVGVPTLAGSVQPGGGGLQNQALAIDGGGAIVGRYAKTHLVPYGEEVPFRSLLGWISALRQIPYDLTPGRTVHVLRIPGLPPIGTPICFENAFPAIDRRMVDEGAGFLVVLTNDASYGTSAASAQQLQMSRMRAVEDGRWVAHAAVSGVSAIVDPQGHVVADRGLFDTGILRATIRSSNERTWYVRLGDRIPVGACALLVIGLLALPRRRRGGAHPGPLPDRPRTLVILPTYDERDTIEWVLEQILDQPVPVDVLVVDDSSPDGTGQLARSFAERDARVRVLSRPRKSGLASAYLDGFHRALAEGYDLVVEMDSDLSHDPEELPHLLAAAGAHDLTVGSRYVPGGSVTNWGRARRALSLAGNVYTRLLLGVPVRDATSGYRVYRRGLLEALVARPFRSDGYAFQIELVWRADRLGFDVGEAPITFREREHGVSKISRRIIAEALLLVTIWGVRSRLGRD